MNKERLASAVAIVEPETPTGLYYAIHENTHNPRGIAPYKWAVTWISLTETLPFSTPPNEPRSSLAGCYNDTLPLDTLIHLIKKGIAK